MGGEDACERVHWDLRWNSVRGTDACVGRTHANVATGAFGGASHRATRRCTRWGGRMRTSPLRPL
eukprot:8729458-Pyramimonas_sp.AAC.1